MKTDSSLAACLSQTVGFTFMLKWRRPLPLVRPGGGWSPPEFEPLDALALQFVTAHAQVYDAQDLCTAGTC